MAHYVKNNFDDMMQPSLATASQRQAVVYTFEEYLAGTL